MWIWSLQVGSGFEELVLTAKNETQILLDLYLRIGLIARWIEIEIPTAVEVFDAWARFWVRRWPVAVVMEYMLAVVMEYMLAVIMQGKPKQDLRKRTAEQRLRAARRASWRHS